MGVSSPLLLAATYAERSVLAHARQAWRLSVGVWIWDCILTCLALSSELSKKYTFLVMDCSRSLLYYRLSVIGSSLGLVALY